MYLKPLCVALLGVSAAAFISRQLDASLGPLPEGAVGSYVMDLVRAEVTFRLFVEPAALQRDIPSESHVMRLRDIAKENKRVADYAARHPELTDLEEEFNVLRTELEVHLLDEER